MTFAFIAYQASQSTAAPHSYDDEPRHNSNALVSVVALCSLVAFVVVGVLTCWIWVSRSPYPQQSPQSQPEDQDSQARQKAFIKDLLKVSEYPNFDHTDTESTASADLEAHHEGSGNDNSTNEETLLEEETGVQRVDCCAICLSAIQSGQRVCQANNLTCMHTFHETCMIAWLLKHSECPICRRDYLSA